jgi:hypothetical protein
MSYLSKQCEEEMFKHEIAVNETFEKIKKNNYPDGFIDENISAKVKKLAYMVVLNNNIDAKHKETYECNIGEGSCRCNLCCMGYDLFYVKPLVELLKELKLI